MAVIRTPDECFADLPGFGYPPQYAEIEDPDLGPLRIHYVDAGPPDAEPVLLLHGNPTWSYLYRKVIPVLTAAGLRAVAPDYPGFGRSDKPSERTDYTFQRFIDWMGAFLRAIDLRRITLVVQDWGGPIGLGALAADPDRFARVLASNTILHTSDPALEGRLTWANHGVGESRVVVEEGLIGVLTRSQRLPDLRPSGSFWGDTPGPAELAAYDAPFPDERYKAGLRQISMLIPLTRGDEGAAIDRATWAVLEQWDRPFRTAYGDSDPATRGWEDVFQERVPGARGQAHTTIAGASHFVQEDQPEALGAAIVDFVRATPLAG